ncbi:hypothetical protein ES702_06678 [subsurface metagenome]
MTFSDQIKAAIFSLIFLGIAEAIYFKQQFFWIIILPITLAFLLAFVWILGPDLIRRKSLKMTKVILPLLLLAGIFFFLILEPSKLLRQIVIFLGLFSFILFFAFYRKIPLERPKDPKNRSVFNVLIFLLTITAFLDFWAAYSVYFSFSLPLWASMLLMAVISFSLFYYLFWAGGIFVDFLLVFAVLLSLIILEIFLILSFWPTDPKTLAIILILVFYTFSGILILKAKKELTKKLILEYLILFILIFALAVGTMNWQLVF